jgi:hypothetical protein
MEERIVATVLVESNPIAPMRGQVKWTSINTLLCVPSYLLDKTFGARSTSSKWYIYEYTGTVA